jgi:hypothetical protein
VLAGPPAIDVGERAQLVLDAMLRHCLHRRAP